MATAAEESDFEIPSWAGRPANGTHLDVMKGEKLIQKLLIDEKKCYYFGRNPKLCDFTVDHASCSRVHAVLIYHKFLKRMFLVDLGSNIPPTPNRFFILAHGTMIGRVRIESRKPEQLLANQTFHFGASTRYYILREKPQVATAMIPDNLQEGSSLLSGEKSAELLGLPDREDELDNLTEFNTARNKRIAPVGLEEDFQASLRKKRKAINVGFMDEEQIINPEDVDPSVGRFRNLVQTSIVSTKRARANLGIPDEEHNPVHGSRLHHSQNTPGGHESHLPSFGPISTKLGLSLPNPAPDVDLYSSLPDDIRPSKRVVPLVPSARDVFEDGPKKKKYAKEAWPGKKPSHLLVWWLYAYSVCDRKGENALYQTLVVTVAFCPPVLFKKLLIDEKKCYYFGRNPKLCDFTVDHASCSRVHAVLIYHKFLKRMFLVDLGSTHGTMIGRVRIESRKPEQLLANQTFHFGASTRYYILREKPQVATAMIPDNLQEGSSLLSGEKSAELLGLPDREDELDNLTEFNTARNKRIAPVGLEEDFQASLRKKRKAINVGFMDEEQIINPEDVDPSVGRFRNLVQTSIVSTKRARANLGIPDEEHNPVHGSRLHHSQNTPGGHESHLPSFGPISTKLGLSLPNPAPDVDLYSSLPDDIRPSKRVVPLVPSARDVFEDGPKKKKYAKEAWPGKKPSHLLV